MYGQNQHNGEPKKVGNFGCFLSGGMCLILVCAILVLSQIDAFNFGTLKNR